MKTPLGGPIYSFPDRIRNGDIQNVAEVETHFKRFPPAPIQPAALGPLLGLCFTNRSGSNYLANILASTGAFNEAGEFFLPGTVLEKARPLGMRSLDDYLIYLRRTLAVGGRLATKLAIGHLVLLGEAGLLDDEARFLLIEREDVLGQAISTCIAWQNLQWTSHQAKTCPDEELVYDRARIDGTILNIRIRMALFEETFTILGTTPHRVRYETLIEDPQAVVDGVAAWLGLGPLTIDPGRINLERQARAVNAAWRARYLDGE